MRCPKCQHKTRAYKTKDAQANTTRNRECLHCGYRFCTVEQFTREITHNERQAEREAWHAAHQEKSA